MLDNAIINLGLMPDVFWNLRFVDYLRLVIHHAKKEATEWDRFRVMYSFILNTNVSRQHQKTPNQLMPLWTDKIAVRKRKKITEADRDRILESIKRNERGINSIADC